MNHGIREFRPRQPIDRQLDAKTFNRILRELESLRITKVVNGTVKKLPSGTEITVLPQRGGLSAVRQPWDLIQRRDKDDETKYYVTVKPGTLNGILPINWDEEFECIGTDVYYAKAVITTDGDSITGVEIEIDKNQPSVQEPQEFAIENSVDYLFGLFCRGSVYRVIADGQITLPIRTWLVASADPPAQPGESPYAIYYLLGP